MPVVVLAAVVVVLGVESPAIVSGMLSNSDLSAPLVIAHDTPDFPGSTVVVGNNGWWSGVWAAQLLFRLPGYGVTGPWVPMLVSIAVVALVAVVAARRWGLLPAVVVALPALTMNGGQRTHLASWDAHAPTWWAMAMAPLVVTAAGRRGRWFWAGAAAIVLVGGGAMSGDQLAWVVVTVPLLGGAAAWWGTDRRAAGLLAGIAMATAVCAFVCGRVASALSFVRPHYPVSLRPLSELGHGIDNAWAGLRGVWGTSLVSGFAGAVGLLAAVLTLVALVIAIQRVVAGGLAPEDRAWAVGWGLGAAGLLAVFTLSPNSEGPTTRYLLGIALASGALAGLAVAQAPRLLARTFVVGACALGIGGAVLLARYPVGDLPAARGDKADRVLALARNAHVFRGYASYWTAPAMQLELDHAVRIASITNCGDRICPMTIAAVSGRYRPLEGQASFVLVDRSPAALGSDGNGWLRELPPGLVPLRTVDLGDDLEMAFFDHDVAADLGPLVIPAS